VVEKIVAEPKKGKKPKKAPSAAASARTPRRAATASKYKEASDDEDF